MKLELSLEQQFSLRSFQQAIDHMNLEQAKAMCLEIYRQKLLQDSTCKQLLGTHWGMETP